ncbi:hypothetical protein [uncultured Pseudomonas sp.]|uniref:hypothetical protein n=1 Tax=uncultured Pseudomonas sp. TaxID=114707 RepID=UPI0025F64A4C|nr:hypothetical protein [uncultured Pseudomonas sp.]
MSTVSVVPFANSYIYVAPNTSCAYMQSGSLVLRTTDGVAFTQTGERPSDFSRLVGSRSPTALFARDNRFSALYVSGNGGASWDLYDVPVDASNYLLFTSAARVLLYYPSSSQIFASANDGQSWTASTSTDVAEIVAVPSGFYMVSANRLAVQYSTDGINWQAVPSDAPIAQLQSATSSGEVFVAAQQGYLSTLAVVKNGRLTSIEAPTARFDRYGLAAVRVGDGVLVIDPSSQSYIAYATLDAAPEALTDVTFTVPQPGGPVGARVFSTDSYLEFTPSGGGVSSLFWAALTKAYETP